MSAPEKIAAKNLRFLGEQDGPSERVLKEKLSALFEVGREIGNAYLAQVDFGDGAAGAVALCLRAQADMQLKLAIAVGDVFSNLFNTREHLDIIFLSDQQEVQLRSVCRPFLYRIKDNTLRYPQHRPDT